MRLSPAHREQLRPERVETFRIQPQVFVDNLKRDGERILLPRVKPRVSRIPQNNKPSQEEAVAGRASLTVPFQGSLRVTISQMMTPNPYTSADSV